LAGTRAQSDDRYGSGTLHSGKILRGSLPLFSPALDVPTIAARCLHVPNVSAPSSERWNCGNFAEMTPFLCHLRWLYFPSKGRHAEDFFTQKIRQLRLNLNPQTWVPEASMLTTTPPKPLSYVYNFKISGFTRSSIYMTLVG
jgi:hypothetical protein